MSVPIKDAAPEAIDLITETLINDLMDLLDASECVVWGANAGKEFRELMTKWVGDNLRLLPTDDDSADDLNDELPDNMK